MPALIVGPGLDLIDGGRAAGLAASADYTAHRYHTPNDVFDPNWDLSGTLEDIQTLYLLGRNLADGDQWPDWYADSEFRAQRDAMMAKQRGRGRSPKSPARRRPRQRRALIRLSPIRCCARGATSTAFSPASGTISRTLIRGGASSPRAAQTAAR